MSVCFYNKFGLALPSVGKDGFGRILKSLTADYGITELQLAESCAYSFAMVIRYALGLSAQGGKVCALVNDSLAGWITLAAVRHLTNAGSEAHVLFLLDPNIHSSQIETLLKPLEKMPTVTLEHWSCRSEDALLSELIESSHNVLCGLCDPFPLQTSPSVPEETIKQFTRVMNELQIPIHSVIAPIGVDLDTGAGGPEPLYASSTLSLGAPLTGLYAGSDFVGRHYLCDLSIPAALYESEGIIFETSPFSDQPVSQILKELPKKTD